MRLLAKIIIAVAIFFVGLYIGQYYTVIPDLTNIQNSNTNQSQEQATESSEELTQVSMMLDYVDGVIKTFNDIEVNDGTSAFKLLEKITQENDIGLNYKDYGGEMGAMIELIGGVENNFDEGNYWQFWVNNTYSVVGASNFELHRGDVIEWKYTKDQLEN